MKRGDFGFWLLITLVFWVPLSFLFLAGFGATSQKRLLFELELRQELLNNQVRLLERSQNPEFRLTLLWRDIRGLLRGAGTVQEWVERFPKPWEEIGVAQPLVVAVGPEPSGVFPSREENQPFGTFLHILAGNQKNSLLERREQISHPRLTLPAFLLERLSRSHRFYPVPLLGGQWWAACGPISARTGDFYLALLEGRRISWPQVNPRWAKAVSSLVTAPCRYLSQAEGESFWRKCAYEGRKGQVRSGIQQGSLNLGVEVDGGWVVLTQPLSWETRLWLPLGVMAWALLSLVWLAGSYGKWVSPDPEHRERVAERLRWSLGLAAGIPLLGILIIGDLFLNGAEANRWHEQVVGLSAKIEEVETELANHWKQSERRLTDRMKTVKPVYTASEAFAMAIVGIDGEGDVSNAHVISSAGVYLLPLHDQNKPSFIFVSRLSAAWKKRFKDRVAARGGRLEPYMLGLLNLTPKHGDRLSAEEVRDYLRHGSRLRPERAGDQIWMKAIGMIGQDLCRQANIRARLQDGSIPGKDTKEGVMGVVAAVAGIEQEEMIGEALRDLGRIRRLNSGKESLYDMVCLVKDEQGMAQNLLLLHYRPEAFTFPAVQRLVNKAIRTRDPTGWYFFCDDHDSVDMGSRQLPTGVRFAISGLDRAGEVRRFALCLPSGEWHLLQVQRSREMDHLMIGRSIPLAPFFSFSQSQRRWWLLSLVFTLLTLGAGCWILWKYLIRPLDDLELAAGQLVHLAIEPQGVRNPLGELFFLNHLFTQVRSSLAQLNLAKIVQEDLFPKDSMQFGNVRLAARSVMMEQVGGDFYDYFPDPRNDKALYVCIGDVSGHGLAAAIVVAMMNSAVRIQNRLGLSDPGAILAAINPHMMRILNRLRMASMQMVHLNSETGEYSVASVGHPPLLIMKNDGTCESVEIVGFPLGTRKIIKVSSHQGKLVPGEGMILNTDGCIEAGLPDGTEMGYKRLANYANQQFRAGFSGVVDRLFDGFIETTGTRAWEDDVTFVVVHFGEPDAEKAGEKKAPGIASGGPEGNEGNPGS